MNDSGIWLITPPFTQINTPYPATCYLKGFLNTIGIKAFQSDLSLEVFLKIYSKQGLERIFKVVETLDPEMTESSFRIWTLQDSYLNTIDYVIEFLQNQRPTHAHRIISDHFLPKGLRFEQHKSGDEVFGTLGLIDKAKHYATLYLEELGDFIQEVVDPYFGFSRYAEKVARSLSNFDMMDQALERDDSITMVFLKEVLFDIIQQIQPALVGITIPFPGNLFSALKCAQFIKTQNPEIRIAIGGGYCNTELRSINDTRIFRYIDFISLDDGEAPFRCLLEYLAGVRDYTELKRTFLLKNEVICFCNGAMEKDIPQREVGIPDYSDLKLTKYLSLLELTNPMHRLWSDGRWNKLTMAHGCYWGKCTFCDVTLDYISRYEPINATMLCDRMELMISQTGERGFHFVDEAAPPALMRDLALEILRRNLVVTWWANIRFEKSFTPDLCRILAASGCIAVSGGLEVASDRLLALIQKGVTVEQVTKVAQAFTHSGIMVHTYLMYGFPTQTDQETIDALEIVRQLFLHEVIQSGYWHLFTMTSHSPVGKEPERFLVKKVGPVFEGFAENDLEHLDPSGAHHLKYGDGLRVSLFNFMNGVGLDKKLGYWFSFKVPRTSVPSDLIAKIIREVPDDKFTPASKIIWIGGVPVSAEPEAGFVKITLMNPVGAIEIRLSEPEYLWFFDVYPLLLATENKSFSFRELRDSYHKFVDKDFDSFRKSAGWKALRREGLLILS